MRLGGISSDTGQENKFLYNGKEFEDENNVPPMVFELTFYRLRSGDSRLRLRALFWRLSGYALQDRSYHYGVRYYDPQLGSGRLSGYALQAHCWMAVDPADEFFSPYVYCHNDPVNFVDPDGRIVRVNQDFAQTRTYKLYSSTEGGKAQLAQFQAGGKYEHHVLEIGYKRKMWSSGSQSSGTYNSQGVFVKADVGVPFGERSIVFKININKEMNERTEQRSKCDYRVASMVETVSHEVDHSIDEANAGYNLPFREGENKVSEYNSVHNRMNIILDVFIMLGTTDFYPEPDKAAYEIATDHLNHNEDVYNETKP